MEENLVKTNTENAAHLLEIFSWVLMFVIGTVVVSVIVVDIMGDEFEKPNSDFWPIMVLCVAIITVILLTARGLKKHQQWARYVGGLTGTIALAAFPVGTVLGLFILSNLKKGWHER